MAGVGGIAGRLYRGDLSVNFVRRQRMWYTISGLILLISIIALLVRGLNFSVQFKGGSIFQFPATVSSSQSVTQTQGEISRVVTAAGGGSSTVQHLTSHLGSQWEVQTEALPTHVTEHVASALEKAFTIPAKSMNLQVVGPTWGGQVSSKAIEALIIFLIVIVIYLSAAFEWKMAIAAFTALLHDIVITIGVYALTGFQVAPATVIGLLTILGYSLYDTVVVFDKVRENTAGLLTTQRTTYSDAANLALNQTLVRSINTSLTALLPVASILFIGGSLLGTGTLNDLSLVLFVGMLSGTYSSICIATPVLADLKEREPRYQALAAKVARRAAGGRAAQRAAADGDADTSGDGAGSAGSAGKAGGGRAAARAGVRATANVGSKGTTAVPDTSDDTADRDEAADDTTGTAEPDGVRVDGVSVDGVTVSAAATAADPPRAEPPRQGRVVRQQPRRSSSAQRRPGARKKKG